MKRKIHITEEQLRAVTQEIAKQSSINEDGELNVSYQKPANGVASIPDMTTQVQNAKKAAPNTDIQLNVSSKDLNITEMYTKRQIKEARLNKLVKESFKVIKKKNLK